MSVDTPIGEYARDVAGGGNSMEQTELVRALSGVIDPIRTRERARLRDIATELKQTDGEHWAAGETLERACIFLDACLMAEKHPTRSVTEELREQIVELEEELDQEQLRAKIRYLKSRIEKRRGEWR